MYGRLIVNCKTRCSKIIFVDRHYRQVDKCWNSIPNFHFLLNIIYCQHPVRKHHLKWRLSSWINNICNNWRTMHYQHNLLSAPHMHCLLTIYIYTLGCINRLVHNINTPHREGKGNISYTECQLVNRLVRASHNLRGLRAQLKAQRASLSGIYCDISRLYALVY